MRRSVYSAISLLLIASFLSFPVFSSGKTANREHPLKNIRAKAETGAKVGQRIKQLRRTNKDLQSALEVFERNGRQPNIDEAVSVVGYREKTRKIAKAHHARQQATISGDGAEVIFITSLHLYNEWQGTVITRFFDANGAVEDEYVSNLVITRSEYSPSEWTVRYDVEYEAGAGYLFHRPGGFTGFQLGTPIQEQAAPLGLDPSQFASTADRDVFYETFPEQTSYDYLSPGGGDGGGGGLILNAHAKAKAPQGGSQALRPVLGPWIVPTLTGWRGAGRDAGIGCTGTAGACGIGSALFSGAPFAPCFVTGCAGSVIIGVLVHVRPTWRNIRP